MFHCFQQQKTILFSFLGIHKDLGVKRYLKYAKNTCWGEKDMLFNVQVLIQRSRPIQSDAAGFSASYR